MGLWGLIRRQPAPVMPEHQVGQGLYAMGRQIQGAFLAQGLPADLELRIQSARTVTFMLAPVSLGLADVAKIGRMPAILENALRTSPVRVSQEQGRIFVEVPSPWPTMIRGTGPGLRRAGLEVGIGLTSRNRVATIDLSREPHILMVGPTQSGKSTAARSIIWHLVEQSSSSYETGVRILVVSGRPADWSGLEGASNVWGVVPPEEALALVTWLRREVVHREAHGLRNPPLVLVMDDGVARLDETPELVGPLSVIVSNGAAAGVHLILCTQRLGKRGAGDAVITGNIRTRLVFGTADAQDAAAFTGRSDSGAETLLGQGDALLIAPGRQERVTVGNVTNEDLMLLPRWRVPLAPWRPQRPTTVYNGAPLQATPTPPTTGVATPTTASTGALEAVTEPNDTSLPTTLSVVQRLDRREPTPDEYPYIRQVKVQLGSNEAACKALWGYKDGKSLGWLKQALGES